MSKTVLLGGTPEVVSHSANKPHTEWQQCEKYEHLCMKEYDWPLPENYDMACKTGWKCGQDEQWQRHYLGDPVWLSSNASTGLHPQ